MPELGNYPPASCPPCQYSCTKTSRHNVIQHDLRPVRDIVNVKKDSSPPPNFGPARQTEITTGP